MIVLGIDPGTTRIGYGLVAKGTPPQFISCGVLSVHTPQSEDRLLEAVRHFRKLIRGYHPSIIALEKLFFVKNQKTGLQVSEMRGALLLTIREEKLRVVEYTPKEVKKNITGNGNADKRAVAKMVRATFPKIEISGPDDVTDAIAIALTALYDIRNRF